MPAGRALPSLRASIGNTGFWPGVLVREAKGSFELLFGHHRIEAARLELGDDYEHQFIVREDVPDHVALKMLADENADSWVMGPQHALLCVKQARDFLNSVLCAGWDEGLRIRGPMMMKEAFGGPDGFASCAAEGSVGERVVRAFLGGAFAKGHGVRDALAIWVIARRRCHCAISNAVVSCGWLKAKVRRPSLLRR